MIRLPFVFRFLLWGCIQEIAADVQGEDQQSAVQVHHYLFLILFKSQYLVAGGSATNQLPGAVKRGQAQPECNVPAGLQTHGAAAGLIQGVALEDDVTVGVSDQQIKAKVETGPSPTIVTILGKLSATAHAASFKLFLIDFLRPAGIR